MKISIEISFKPTQQQMDIIEGWLIDEDKDLNQGFYCNWNIIQSSFNKNGIAIISLNRLPIGFAIWNHSLDYTVTLDIVEINPKFRGQGFGNILISQLFEYFKSKKIVVVDLQCSPANSENYWRKLKFAEFPDFMRRNGGNKNLYKVLIPSNSPQIVKDSVEQIELWNGEPFETRNKKPTWTWKIKFIKGTRQLAEPIIFPCHYDWRIRWKKDNTIIVDDKVKYFGTQEICFGKYIIINQLKTIP